MYVVSYVLNSFMKESIPLKTFLKKDVFIGDVAEIVSDDVSLQIIEGMVSDGIWSGASSICRIVEP